MGKLGGFIMNKNKTLGVIIGSGLAVLGLALTYIASNGFHKVIRLNANDYSITLNSSNKVTGNIEDDTRTITTDSGAYQVDFSYKNVSSYAGGHATINAGGSIVNKDHILSIFSIQSHFSTTGALKFRTSYDGATWNEYTSMTSGQLYSLGSNPYYVEFATNGTNAVNITDIAISYTCTVNPDAAGTTVTTEDTWTRVSSLEDLSEGDEIVITASYGSNWFSLQNATIEGRSYWLVAEPITLSSDYSTATVTDEHDTWIISNGTASGTRKFKSGSNYLKAETTSTNYNLGLTTTYNSTSCDWSLSFTNSKVVMSCNDVFFALKRYGSSPNYGYEFAGYSSNQDYPRYIYKKIAGTSSTTYDIPKDEVGFTAVDNNSSSYNIFSVFDTDNDLSVVANFNDGSTKVLSHGGTSGYSYTIYDPLDVAIDTSVAFGTPGNYTLVVSYMSYIPVEITLHVDDLVYPVNISPNMSTVTFTTADTLANNLTGNLSAVVQFSDSSTNTVQYSAFGSNNLKVELLTPKGITYTQSQPFGTAGTWTVKVVSTVDSSVYGTVNITVNAVPVASITLNETSYTMVVEGTLQLTTIITPNTATNDAINWESSDEDVASVSETGLVTAVAIGGATITATAADGSGVYAQCVITVNAKPATTDYSIDASSQTQITTISTSSLVFTNTPVTVSISKSSSSTNANNYCPGGTNNSSTHTRVYSGQTFRISAGGLAISSIVIHGTSDKGVTGFTSPTWTNASKSSSGNEVTLTPTDPESDVFCTISAASSFSGVTVTVGDGSSATPVYPTAISLTGEGSLTIGGTSQLSVGYTPSDTNVKNVTYTSSNDSVATVSTSGLVTGVATGSATITATAQASSGTVTATKNISVSPVAVTSVSLNSNSETIKSGKTVTLVPTISPSNATNKNVTWTSSDTGVATVSEAGVVTGVTAGSSTITVTTVDGSKTATCVVTVTDAAGMEEFSISYTDLPTAYTSGTYTSASGIKFSVNNCANYTGSSMQFKKSGGYLQTTESLDLYSITINDPTSNSLTVYGSNTAGSFSTTISGDNDTYDLQGYSYFKLMNNNSGAAYCSSVTVTTGIPTPTDPTDIILDSSSCEIATGGSKTIGVSYVPSNANQNKDITWTSSNSSVATVDSTGKITVSSTASAGQSAIITAKLTNIPSISKTVAVTVVEQQKDDHTVLIYMCGADLESENHLATGDIQEILKVNGQPDDVNIVIETGGAKSWASTYGISSTYLERWHVENKSLVKDETLPEYASMGLSSTLQSFIEYGLNNYPAERTGLIFWNHGGGMRGVCYDEKKNDDVLKNSEIKSAISGALSNCNITDKLEWVGYDACLMAVQDIAETNSAYFNYMIASEESEAGYGWDYDNWVDDLYSKKSTTTILKAIVDSFISDNGGASSSSSDQTLSYLDLSYAAAYKTAWENLAAQLNSVVTSSNKSSFNSAITGNVKHYADSDYDYFCTFDAWDFVDKLENNSAFSSFRVDASYTTAVKNAHANLVAYNLAQKGAGVSKGLCMYWPNSSQYSDVSTYYTTSETNFTTWRSFCVNKGTHA